MINDLKLCCAVQYGAVQSSSVHFSTVQMIVFCAVMCSAVYPQ